MEKKINVLGTAYAVKYKTALEDARLDDVGGLTDETTQEILIKSEAGYPDSPSYLADMSVHVKHVARHELVHAFLCESGQHMGSCPYATEEAVDWIAAMIPRMVRVMEQLGVLE